MFTYFWNDMFQAHSACNIVDGIQVDVMDGRGASAVRDIRYFFIQKMVLLPLFMCLQFENCDVYGAKGTYLASNSWNAFSPFVCETTRLWILRRQCKATVHTPHLDHNYVDYW